MTIQELETINKKFNEEYDFLYQNYDRVAGFDEAVAFFDNGGVPSEILRELSNYRHDLIVSDRECGALVFALNSLGYI